MPTNLKQGAKILFDTINYGLRHQDYNRVIEVAKDFTIYATGKGISDKLQRFNSRESTEQHVQRLLLTIPNVQDIFFSCVKPLTKVGRTPATINLSWANKDTKETVSLKNQLVNAAKNFWGKKDVNQYITQRQADLDSTDPNSFVVIEFKEAVDPSDPNSKAKPYPFEVNSAEAINYCYKNNDLQWLVVLNGNKMIDKKGIESIGETYYIYIDNESIKATQITKDTVDQYVLEQNLIQIDNLNDINLLPSIKQKYLYTTADKKNKKSDGKYFIIEVFEHKIGFVPAIRFGTVLDPQTRYRTCLPLIFAAQSYFDKSIKAMSEFDLTNCLHVFPRLLVYADACQGEPMGEDMYIGCMNGMRPDGKTTCNACHGTGFKGHISAQDVIQVRMPKDLKDIVPLENLIAYKTPPIELLEIQKKFGFYELRQLAQGAVYNSDVFTKDQVVQTATGKMIDLDAVYDTLKPYADTYSEIYIHIYRCIAALRDIDTELVIEHKFPSDFKMESLGTLLDYLQKANANGAPSYIKKSINKKITHKVYIDEPREVQKIETKDKYFPFAGKTESEINYILANDLTTNFNKIFYANFDNIFSELEFDSSKDELDFYDLSEEQQTLLIETKVNELIDEIDNEDANSSAEAFNSVMANEISNIDNDKEQTQA